MNQSYTKMERAHLEAVKSLPCSVCHAPAPSEAHHIRQRDPFIVVALCLDCHQGKCGIHGDKSLWRIYKMDELDALNITIERLCEKGILK